MFLCVLNAEKYMAISWISHKVMLRPKQTTPNSGSLLSTPKGITRPAYPTYTSTIRPSQIFGAIDNKKLHVHLWHCPTPILLLWWCCEPPITFYASEYIGEESAANGMIQIGPEEGKKSRFCVWKCMNISLTHRWYVRGLLMPTMQQFRHSAHLTVTSIPIGSKL
jgi:hypothetical protein